MSPTDANTDAAEEVCQKEVLRVHAFFVDWFTGKLEKSTDILDEQFSGRLSDDFVMINPQGRLLSKPQLVTGIMQAHNSHTDTDTDTDTDFEIHIHNVQLLQNLTEELKLVSYEEWQRISGKTTARRSTAVMKINNATSIEWKSVHETWLEGQGPTTKTPKAAAAAAAAATTPKAQEPAFQPASLISPRRHVSDKIASFAAKPLIEDGTTLVGLEFRGLILKTLQGPMANEAWLDLTTTQLLELCQYDSQEAVVATRRRRINLPEVCFSQAAVQVVIIGSGGGAATAADIITLEWTAHAALEAWSRAHAALPMGSALESPQGVSVLKTVDAALWSNKTIQNTDFHFDWTYSTPFSVKGGTCCWNAHPKSGMNISLLQDTTQPILYFDEIELYEDDLHDNGVVNLRVKVRLMPTCLYVLSRCWLRVDGSLLKCRETRVMVEFISSSSHHKVCRDITWRHCQWADLPKYGLPTDARAWKNEGSAETAAWNALVNRLPSVDLPEGMPKHSVLEQK